MRKEHLLTKQLALSLVILALGTLGASPAQAVTITANQQTRAFHPESVLRLLLWVSQSIVRMGLRHWGELPEDTDPPG